MDDGKRIELKEDEMINAIGEATMQQFVRMNYNAENYGKDLEVRKTDKIKAQRPIEKSEDGKKSEMNSQTEKNIRSHNILEGGQLVVEKYDEDGKLVKKIPPGYLPPGETI
jgi:hypothetical protein